MVILWIGNLSDNNIKEEAENPLKSRHRIYKFINYVTTTFVWQSCDAIVDGFLSKDAYHGRLY